LTQAFKGHPRWWTSAFSQLNGVTGKIIEDSEIILTKGCQPHLLEMSKIREPDRRSLQVDEKLGIKEGKPAGTIRSVWSGKDARDEFSLLAHHLSRESYYK
jgi:hypothetical protein